MVDLVTAPLSRAHEMGFFSDASAGEDYGFGSIFGNRWIQGQWEMGFIKNCKPSIKYLELFALCAGILTWQKSLQNIHLLVHCDNQAVVHMINGMVSSCKNCMKLLRILVLDGLIYNRQITAVYVTLANNFLSDALSRGQMTRFRKLGPTMLDNADRIHKDMWPLSNLWIH